MLKRNHPETKHTERLTTNILRNILTSTRQGFLSGVCDENDHLEFGRTPHTHPYIKQLIWKQFCFLHTLETLCELVRGFPGFLDFADFRISRASGISEFRYFRILGFGDVGISGSYKFSISRFQRRGLLNFTVLRFMDVGISEFQGFWIWGLPI